MPVSCARRFNAPSRSERRRTDVACFAERSDMVAPFRRMSSRLYYSVIRGNTTIARYHTVSRRSGAGEASGADPLVQLDELPGDRVDVVQPFRVGPRGRSDPVAQRGIVDERAQS